MKNHTLMLLTLIAALLIGGCSGLSSVMKSFETIEETTNQLADPLGEGDPKAAEEDTASPDAPAQPVTTAAAAESEAEIRCCINGAYYQCQGTAAANQCIGQPMALMNCVQGCGFDSNCEPGCIKKHGPDPSSCDRQPARDNECPRR